MKNLVKKKLYLITSTDLGSETLSMLGIRVIMKLGGMTHQVEPEDKSEGKKKARLEKHKLTR